MSFVNNPNGLESAIRTPEIRAQQEAASKGFGKLLATMAKKGLSFDGESYFIDSNGDAHYDKFGGKVEIKPTPAPVVAPTVQPVATARPTFIAPPTTQPAAITVEAIVHQFKIYDAVQQQILLTILNQ